MLKQPQLRRVLEALIYLMDFNRAGPLKNATLSEYQQLERCEDCRPALRVEKHKTSATHGPANLPLTHDIVQHLDMFVSEYNYRPKLNAKETNQLFRSAKPDNDMKHPLACKQA